MLGLLPDKCIIGMVHLLPLPDAPCWQGDFAAVLARAVADAQALENGGVDGLLVENFGDVPFAKAAVAPATIAAMALAVATIRQSTKLPVGVNVLRNDAIAALDIAATTGAHFIRVNVLSGAMVTDQGIVEGDGYRLLRRRAALNCSVKILADVLVKHAAPLGAISIERAAADLAYRALADALIVTGEATGASAGEADIARARAAVPDRPLLVGSGVRVDNVQALFRIADGVIVGTALKRDGQVGNPVDVTRVTQLVRAARSGGAQ